MSSGVLLFLGFIIILIGLEVNKILKPPPVPTLDETWWGKGDSSSTDKSIKPFKINISKKELDDLKWRLENHRQLVPPLEGIAQEYGTNTKLLNEITDFWRTKYNWKEREQFLNKYPQFKTNIQGLDIHFIHIKPEKIAGVKTLPLLLLHGWPGSVREFYEIIPFLTKPKDGQRINFEVVVASLPGFGFSDPALRPGLGAAQMAVVFKNLMKRLGHEQFYVQGGDFGAIILQQMSVLFPQHVLGFHSNMCTVYTTKSMLYSLLGTIFPSLAVKPEHWDRMYPLKEHFHRALRESGYLHLQATKPDTLGAGLTDSPIGLASYILEKFIIATNRTFLERQDGGLKEFYTYTDLLDNVMIYWWTRSATTSFRLYSETFNKTNIDLGISRIPITIPTACARFENDFYASDPILKELYLNLLQLSDHKGGHFAAFQLPEVLADDIFSAIAKFEEYNLKNVHA